jgi:hypothetical protein
LSSTVGSAAIALPVHSTAIVANAMPNLFMSSSRCGGYRADCWCSNYPNLR